MTQGATVTSNYAGEALRLFAGYGDAEAIVHGARRLSFADVVTGVRALAGSLRRHGVRPGSAVAVLANNVPESILVQFALHLLGCRTVWISAVMPAGQCVEALRRAEVDAFVYNPRTHADLGGALVASAPSVRCLCLGSGGLGPDLTADADAADADAAASDADASDAADADADADRAAPDDAADPGAGPAPQSLFQTGGTTGRPKLVQHRHEFFTNLLGSAQRYLAGGSAPPRHLAVTGVWHSSGLATVLLVLLTGGLVVMHERFDPDEWLATVERERITSASLPPAMLYQVLDHPALPGTDTSSLAMVSVAGSALAPSRLAQALEVFGPAVLPSYGMSEATLIAAYPMADHDPAQPQRLASCGRPVSSSRVEIRGEAGQVLPAGEVGEVWASALLMTAGYWGEPELTAQTIVDGWLRTGDVGYLDNDGYLYLVDRVKDMIPTGLTSTNVYSRTVEDALYTHPDVRAAAVVGIPHEAFGEAVHAVIELSDGSATTPEELRRWAVERLGELWAPRTVELVDRMPLTPMGKIDKKVLRARHRPG